ncbi:MAG TPA: hypothetical protein VG273_15145 [Bryobacteraceae bacterium]|nr:hypothetical protein [Bryobacteraceae bacterium]
MKSRDREYEFAKECMGIGGKREDVELYLRLRLRVSDARLERELARLALEKHRQADHDLMLAP